MRHYFPVFAMLGGVPDAALTMLLFNRMRLCDWTDFAPTRDAVLAGSATGSLRLPPFEALCIADDPALHLRCASQQRCLPKSDDALP